MGDVTLRLVVNGDQLTVLDQAGNKLQGLGSAAQQAGGASGLGALTKGATDMMQGIQGSIGIAQQAVTMFGDVQKGGEAVQHAFQALDQMSHGQAPAYMKAMQESTHGLVTDMDLAHAAALGLSTGIASNAAEMAKITGIGASLGEVFMDDATQGVTMFESALEHVGQTRPLAQLGYDIQAVKDRFGELTKQGMDKADAWKQTLIELAPTFSDTGNAWDKLMVRSTNSMNDFKNNAATGFNGIMGTIDLLNSKKVTVDVVFNAVRNEDFSYITRVLGMGGLDVPTITPMGRRQPSGGGPATLSGGAESGIYPYFGPDGTWYGDTTGGSGGGGGGGAPTSLRGMQQNGGLGSNASPFTSSESSARGNARGGYNVQPGYEPQSDRLALAADSAQRLQAATDAAATSTRKGSDAAADFDFHLQNMSNNANKVANNLSLAQAFGTTNGGIGGEIGGGLSSDVSAERAAMVKKGASKADLAQFDATSKQALDQYKIATGQATPESVKFSDALAAVDKSAQAGKISVGEAANEYLALANAAKTGATSVSAIDALMGGMSGTGGTTKTTVAGGAVSNRPGMEDARHGGGMKTAVMPFDDIKTSADDSMTHVNNLAKAIPAIGDNANAVASITVAANIRITGSYVMAAGAALAFAAAQKLAH